MPRLPLHAASGTGIFSSKAKKVIRFARYGCTNRPFYHVVVMHANSFQKSAPIEQLGTFDPLPNVHNEKLVAFNFERIQYWLGMGAHLSRPVAELLGLSGFLPIHPRMYFTSWRARKQAEINAMEEAAKAEKEAAAAQ